MTEPVQAEVQARQLGRFARLTNTLMAVCLGVMAVSVFSNVVLRYGFGTGVAASEELSRLLFVWMVFIGATAAYPAGEHMAFTSFVASFQRRPRVLLAFTVLIRLLVLLACVFLVWGAWGQIVVSWNTDSVVMGYPMVLLPLPALLCALCIGVMAFWELVQRTPLHLGHSAEMD